MKQFEYSTITFHPNFVKPELVLYGKDGWELISVVPIPSSENCRYYFKREILQPKDPIEIIYG